MNKNIILKALQTELETVKADAISHETNVYDPAVSKLTDKVTKWFANNVIADLHSITLGSDYISIIPSDTTSYGNSITIYYRSSWRKENAYFESSSYRPDLDSREDNTHSIHYYNAMAAIANNFDAICNEYKTKWLPVLDKLNEAKTEKYNAIYNIEREIRNCENEIATIEMEAYNKSGFECTLTPSADYNSNYDNNETVYTKTYSDKHVKAQYGRGRWEYAYINSFKVVSFPKAKHAKVVLEYKGSASDEKTRTVELNKARYAEFVRDVYNWQTKGAAEREESIDDRIARWSEKTTA